MPPHPANVVRECGRRRGGSFRVPRSAFRVSSGFTLIELMVVVVVILILLGIAAGVGQWAIGSGEEQLTRTALANMQQIHDEYTNTVGGTFTQTAGTVGTINLVAATKGLNTFETYYAAIPENLKSLTGSNHIVKDAWGTTLHYVPANTAYQGNGARNAPYFMSAGRDLNIATQADNLYSYQTIK